ncbi:hypothetical protein BGZ94_004015, partial [Podila epigama]
MEDTMAEVSERRPSDDEHCSVHTKLSVDTSERNEGDGLDCVGTGIVMVEFGEEVAGVVSGESVGMAEGEVVDDIEDTVREVDVKHEGNGDDDDEDEEEEQAEEEEEEKEEDNGGKDGNASNPLLLSAIGKVEMILRLFLLLDQLEDVHIREGSLSEHACSEGEGNGDGGGEEAEEQEEEEDDNGGGGHSEMNDVEQDGKRR